MELGFGWIEELPEREREQLKELERIFKYHYESNRTKARYYAGRITNVLVLFSSSNL